jgi:hypothetical protein
VRADSYKELGKAFNASQPNCASELFKNHIDEWKNYIADGNPGAQTEAIECFLLFCAKVKQDLLAQF